VPSGVSRGSGENDDAGANEQNRQDSTHSHRPLGAQPGNELVSDLDYARRRKARQGLSRRMRSARVPALETKSQSRSC
jgi:hypothetical protein